MTDNLVLQRDKPYPPGVSPSKSRPHPTVSKDRIVVLDALRGFALLGILLMNIQLFAMPYEAYMDPAGSGYFKGADFWIWLLSHVLAEEKFITMFSMLFGAGIVLMTARIEQKGISSWGWHFRRMAGLLLIGLAHAYLLWSGDVLVTYAVCGSFVYFCRRFKPRLLLILGGLLLLIGAGLPVTYELVTPFTNMVYQIVEWLPRAPIAANEVVAYQGSWVQQMQARVPQSIHTELFLLPVVILWRTMGLMLVGMALFKLGLLDGKGGFRWHRAVVGLSLMVGIPTTVIGAYFRLGVGWNSPSGIVVGSQFIYWASLLVSLGWIGLIILAARLPMMQQLIKRLAAVGKMALTNYLLQSVVCTAIFYGSGLGLFGKMDRVGQISIVVAVWLLQLTWSPIWLRRFQFGPMEWLWRSFIYLRLEPLRIR
jgi:uncharacterized protein